MKTLPTQRRLVMHVSVAVAAVGFVWAPWLAAGQTAEPPRTPWGAPDLDGVWDFRTITPLERPAALQGKSVLTAEEAAEFTRQSAEGRDADRRDGGAQRDVERAYNDFWWDWGNSLTGDLRTSLIVDPPDGRIPEQTEAARERALAARANGIRPVRGPSSIKRTGLHAAPSSLAGRRSIYAVLPARSWWWAPVRTTSHRHRA